MKRTTVMLPDHLAALVESERRARDVSTAAVIREAVERYFAGPTEPKRLGFANLGCSGFTDTATRVEEILAEEWGSEEGRNRLMYGSPDGPLPSQQVGAGEIERETPTDVADHSA